MELLPMQLRQQRWSLSVPPTVSVLVLAYNHERYIADCLNGILDQVTDFPVEIIVHDDASADDTATIIRQFADQYPAIIKPILQTENQVSQHKKIRPLLLRMARGDFIANCDGDDYWLDAEKLVKQVGFLRRNPGYVLCYHDALHIDENGAVTQEYNLPPKGRCDYTKEELRELKWGWILLGTMMHRNVKIDFPPEYNLVRNNDNFMPMLLASYGGAKFQADVGKLAYRQHPRGIWSMRSKEEQVQMYLQSYLQIAAYFVRIGEVSTARRILSGRLAKSIDGYMKATEPEGTKEAMITTYGFVMRYS